MEVGVAKIGGTGLPEKHSGPGLVDLQLNGYAGFDFNSAPQAWTAEAFHAVAEALARRGVVAALPTLITASSDGLTARARAYAAIVERAPELETVFPRLHVEGPFISSEDGPRGAHPAAHCRTPRSVPDLLERLQEASGDRIGILTLAPELPGALELIATATEQGICVAIGHTQASPEVIREAVQAGARMSTHLGNGSHQVMPRLANYVQAQLAEDGLFASFIADGHHLPWYTLKNFIRAKRPERCVLVTDAISGADAPPGRYPLGEEEVVVSADLRVQKPGALNLAGSALTLDRAVVNVATWCGVAFSEAWEMASSRAAGIAGLDPPRWVSVKVSTEGFEASADLSSAQVE